MNLDEEYIGRLVEVAHSYYLDHQTQAQIAKSLGLSRSMVSRDLTMARDLGIVEIRISDTRKTRRDLAEALVGKFRDLKDAVVTPTFSDSPDAVRSIVGRFAANYVSDVLRPGQRIVLGCGRTLRALVDALPLRKIAGVTVVQAMGNIGHEAHHIDYNSIAQQAAQQLGERAYYVSAPAILGDGSASDFINRNLGVKQSLQLASRGDVYVVGLGSLESDQLYAEAGLIEPAELAYLKERAVGDICARFFDAEGQPVEAPFESRTVGIQLADLRSASLVIGVAGGADKIGPLVGAIRGGYLKTLITDEQTARDLCSMT